MWNKTKVSEILNIQYPILQGPFGGGLSSAKLVSIVSNSGGLGGYGAYHLQPEEIIQIDNEIKSLTNKPYNLNLWVSDVDKNIDSYSVEEFEKLKEIFAPYFLELNIPLPQIPDRAISKFEKQVETILKIKPPVLSFIFGIPSPEIIRECKKANIKTIGTATTIDEAIALDETDVDLIIASGFEAGGHRASFLRSPEDSLTGTFVLIPQITNYVKAPVIAAGGIVNANGIVAALSLGASGVQIGTAFLACRESNAPKEHKEKIFSKEAKYSTLTRTFTGRLARGIKSELSENIKLSNTNLAPFPLQAHFISSLRKAAIQQNKIDLITFWMGQNAVLVKYQNAEELMKSLINETESILKRIKV